MTKITHMYTAHQSYPTTPPWRHGLFVRPTPELSHNWPDRYVWLFPGDLSRLSWVPQRAPKETFLCGMPFLLPKTMSKHWKR